MAVPLELLDCFEILGVSPGAHPGEIRSAFRRLALSFHPDVAGPQGACRFEAIAAAYSVLKSASPVEIADALKKGRKAPGTPPGKDRGGSPFRWRRKKQAPPSPSEKKKEEEEGSGRVRELLLERALVEAELSVARLLEKAGEGENDGDVSRVVRRLLGAHPKSAFLP
jgi:curved DNA-binding protein CbpA